MPQNINAKPDNMLLNEWYQRESDCDRRQHGWDKQTDAVSQMLNTANILQQMPWLNKMWSHNICLSGWEKSTCSHGHRFIDFSWELKISKAHLKSNFSKVGIFCALLPSGYYYQPSLQHSLHVIGSRTVSESSFIKEENSKLLVTISSTILLCLDTCCFKGSSPLLTQLISQLTLPHRTGCENAHTNENTDCLCKGSKVKSVKSIKKSPNTFWQGKYLLRWAALIPTSLCQSCPAPTASPGSHAALYNSEAHGSSDTAALKLSGDWTELCWVCLPMAYALKNEGIPSRIFAIDAIQPQVLCMIFSDFLKAQKRQAKQRNLEKFLSKQERYLARTVCL